MNTHLSKLPIVFGLSVYALTSMAAPSGGNTSSACKPFASYQVSKTSFTDQPLSMAVKTLVSDTPFQVVGDEGPRVSATNIQGSLDVVLNYLAFKTDSSFMREGCSLHIKAPQPAPAAAPAPMSVEVLGGKGVADGAAPAPVASPDAAPLAPKVWRVLESDKTLNSTFERWATEEGWTFVWDVRAGDEILEYPVSAEAAIEGSFEEVVEAVVASLQTLDIPPRVHFSRGNRVVRFVARGDAGL